MEDTEQPEKKRRGPPEKLKDGRRRNVYLDAATWAAAEKIGGGSASEGIRQAVAEAVTSRSSPRRS